MRVGFPLDSPLAWPDYISTSGDTLLKQLSAELMLKYAYSQALEFPRCARRPNTDAAPKNFQADIGPFVVIPINDQQYWAFKSSEHRQVFLDQHPDAEIFPSEGA